MRNFIVLLAVLAALALPAGFKSALADQYDFGTIDPDETSGSELATLLGDWRDALNSTHSGTSRPAYAAAGGLWLDTTASTWVLYVYDGSQDIVLGTVNTTTNQFTPYYAGAVVGTMAAQGAGAVAITGGSITGITDLAIADGGTGASTAAAGFANLKQAATESATGVVEFGTTAECEAGALTSVVCTPAGVAAYVAANTAPGDWELIELQTVSGAASIQFDNFDEGACAALHMRLTEITPSSSNAELYFRSSTNNGTGYDSGSSNYVAFYQKFDSTGTTAGNAATLGSGNRITLNISARQDTGEGVSGWISVPNPSNATEFKFIEASLTGIIDGDFQTIRTSGYRNSTADQDAYHLAFTAGNISGTAALYCLHDD